MVMQTIFKANETQLKRSVNRITEFLRSEDNLVLMSDHLNRGYYKVIENNFAKFILFGSESIHLADITTEQIQDYRSDVLQAISNGDLSPTCKAIVLRQLEEFMNAIFAT